MKITEILSENKLTMSFEVFPPKTDTAFENVRAATEAIADLHPAYVSVTYGAGGGTSRYTLDIAKTMQERHGVPALAHLTCISSTRETVRTLIDELRAAGIRNVLAMRGDIPADMQGTDRSTLPYRYAVDLVRELRESGGDFCIGGACYPEVHPESADQRTDILYLKEKVDAGCDFLTTQMFFDNNLYYNFLYKIRESGITVPVIPGIMPITDAGQIRRALELSGSFMPRRFTALVDKFGHSPAAMMQAGIVYATDQIIDLYANGIRNVHVFTMNKPHVARRILENVSEILGKEAL